MADPPLLEVGRIVRAHGIRGEVVVEAVSNRPERFATGSELAASPGAPGVAGSPGVEPRRFVVLRSGPHGGPERAGRVSRSRWIVAFEGVEDRNQAEILRGTVLFGEPLPGDELDDDELWVHELVGAEVTDPSGTVLGRVAAVEANPASDLLVLEEGALVPMVFVVESAPGRVVIDPPAGLFDL
ncbi:MAG: ribosome maturation factor RimM [Actinomycetota bacterium]|nr:ribosome maturation factor RimM [Actinomycetota bacterium]